MTFKNSSLFIYIDIESGKYCQSDMILCPIYLVLDYSNENNVFVPLYNAGNKENTNVKLAKIN